MNRKILAAAVAGAITPMAAQALDVSVSGQVNRAIRFADNGVGSDVQHIDGSASGSRFRFTAEGEAMPGITAGAHIEQGFTANGGGGLDVEAEDKGKGTFEFRHSYVYFSGDFGQVTLGHTTPAGNGIMWSSHNGAWMGTEYSPDSNSGIHARTSDGAGMGSVFSFFPSVNIGRMNTLRYNTPSIGPVSFSGSVQKDGATDHAWSFGASLSHDVGAASVMGGLILMDDVLGIAGGIAFANGTSVNAAWGSDEAGLNPLETGPQDYEDMYVNVAHSWGSMSVALDYRTTKDSNSTKEGRAIGLGAQYALGGGVNVYAGFNNYSFEQDGYDIEDVNAFHIGSRVTFN
jgi:predicted porin